jgi:cysteine desulfurase / selenocysteine lyase
MKKIKADFPIFENNPWLVYLDNAASTQKPRFVIDGVSDFVSKDYANIHRGSYSLSERSEEMYYLSKETVASFINCKPSEIVYSYNSTYAINIIAQSLAHSWILWEGDNVLLGIWEHHSDILPWMILSEKFGFGIRFMEIADDYDIDWKDFEMKYDATVKLVACSQVSNVTWGIYDIKELKSKLRPDTFFLVDGSQSVPNIKVDVQDIGCDCLIFTWHKLMAYTGIWVVYLQYDRIKKLKPLFGGWWTVQDVSQQSYDFFTTNEKFESGTPNIIWAVSLMKSIEYINSLWWIDFIRKNELELISYTLDKFVTLWHGVNLVWPLDLDRKIGVFSFNLPSNTNQNMIWEIFAEKNVCIRCGGHCAYPLHKFIGRSWTCRMSLYVYNDKQDIDRFFEVLQEIIH